MKNLQERTALVTGASRGLGPYVARALARQGVNLVLTARSADALEDVAREMTGLGVKAVPIPADITDAAAREALLEQAKTAIGPLDILINNAGMEWVSRYTSMSPEDIETMVRTNLVAPLLLSRLVLPDMRERADGHIVMMSSLGGKKGSPYSATYAATKAGLIEWTSGIREELRGTGVSASVICPGFVTEAGMFAEYHKRAPKMVGETTPEKVADAVIRAIGDDVGEIVVNPGPVKLSAIMNAVSPTFTSWLLRTFGVYEFYRDQADENERSVAVTSNESEDA